MGCNGVKVLGSWQSPFVIRARIALNIKSVAYEFQQEDVLVSKSDLLLQSNPVHKRVPVLLHHGNPICEALTIVEYIDDVWASGPAILPSDPYDRATARFWASYIDDTWYPHLLSSLLTEGDASKKSQEETSKGLLVLEEAFAKRSGGGKFFGGERIGHVDIALGCLLAVIAVVDKACNTNLINESTTPNLFKWAHHFSADAAVKELLPETDKLYDFTLLLISTVRASATQN